MKGELNAYKVDSAQPIPLDMLHPAYPIVFPDNYEKIKASVETEGLQWPIVIWNTTFTEWDKLHKENPDVILPCPSNFMEARCFLVMCGNNRYNIAKELEYESIDCIVCENREEINKWAKMMRDDWRDV